MARLPPAFQCLILLLIAGGVLHGQEVRIEEHADIHETHYSIEPGQSADCRRISWYVSHSRINDGIAHVRVVNCGLPMDAQLRLHARILAVVAAKEPALQTLFVGRLGRFAEHAQRLALAAKESGEWNARTGRLKKVPPPALSSFVEDLVRRKGVLAEWERLFASTGQWEATVSGVEEVTVSRAGDVPSLEPLRSKGVLAVEDRLPVDCLVWLKLRRVVQK